LLCGLLLTTAVSSPAQAEERSERELFDLAFRAYQNADYLTATIYLTAYVERDPAAMRVNPNHAGEVREALRYARLVVEQYTEVAQLRSDLRTCRNQCSTSNVGSSVSGITVSPPDLNPPPATTHISYPLVCRGGGSLRFTLITSSDLSSEPLIRIAFEKAALNVGYGWENVRWLNPGQCSWLDRTIGGSEPSQIVLREPELHVTPLSIDWSNGQVWSNTTSDMASIVNALQQSTSLQSFDVYNDSAGNFITTALADPAWVADYVPLYRVVDIDTNGTLDVRDGPAATSLLIGQIPWYGNFIEIIGPGTAVSESLWVPIRYDTVTGWVDSQYLAEQGNLLEYDLAFARTLVVQHPPLRGIDVRVVERRLVDFGYGEVGLIDGEYDDQTKSAVTHFQQDYGLEVDGSVGFQTWQMLFDRSLVGVPTPVHPISTPSD
jgi:peptidoglycan hydrolase-like protein with peptidoglycan-binding domain